jgi:hypothetical protein
MDMQQLKDLATNTMLQEGKHPTLFLIEGQQSHLGIKTHFPETEAGLLALKLVGAVAGANKEGLGDLLSITFIAERLEMLMIVKMHLPEERLETAIFEIHRVGKLVDLLEIEDGKSVSDGLCEPLNAFVQGYAKGLI